MVNEDNRGELARHLEDLEFQMLQPETRGSRAMLSRLIADEFCEFGSSGRVYTKKQIISALAVESPAELSMSRFQVRLNAENVALVTYDAVRRDPADGSRIISLRSSVWVFREDRWQIVFHQGTRTAASGMA